MKEGILIRWKLRRDASNMKSTFPIIESIKHVRLKVLLGISYASTVPLHVIKMVWKCKHLYWNYFMNVIPKYNIHAHLAHSWIKRKIKSKYFKKELRIMFLHHISIINLFTWNPSISILQRLILFWKEAHFYATVFSYRIAINFDYFCVNRKLYTFLQRVPSSKLAWNACQ